MRGWINGPDVDGKTGSVGLRGQVDRVIETDKGAVARVYLEDGGQGVFPLGSFQADVPAAPKARPAPRPATSQAARVIEQEEAPPSFFATSESEARSMGETVGPDGTGALLKNLAARSLLG